MNRGNDEYTRLMERLRTGEKCLSFWMDGVSQQTIDEAIARGDAVREGQMFMCASPQLIARLQAEEAQSESPDKNLTKLNIEQNRDNTATEEESELSQAYKRSPRAFAVEWLRELLQEPCWVEDILHLAQEKNISFTTLKRAKKIVGARSVKIGGYFGGKDTRWFWRLR